MPFGKNGNDREETNPETHVGVPLATAGHVFPAVPQLFWREPSETIDIASLRPSDLLGDIVIKVDALSAR